MSGRCDRERGSGTVLVLGLVAVVLVLGLVLAALGGAQTARARAQAAADLAALAAAEQALRGRSDACGLARAVAAANGAAVSHCEVTAGAVVGVDTWVRVAGVGTAHARARAGPAAARTGYPVAAGPGLSAPPPSRGLRHQVPVSPRRQLSGASGSRPP